MRRMRFIKIITNSYVFYSFDFYYGEISMTQLISDPAITNV